MEAHHMTNVPGTTMAEKLGAAAGLWAVFWIGLHYVILREAAADPLLPAPAYAAAIAGERMRWEWATALRLMGGLMVIWFMGSLAGRLRLVEGEPGRLASIAFGTGVLWGSVWVLSAMFNSAAILLATTYQMVLILSPSIVFVLALATSFVAFRFGGFSRAYVYGTGLFTAGILALAIADWYGPGTLSGLIMTLALGWIGLTSAILIPPYRPPDMVRGAR
jgi:hypothetical protein